MTALQIKQANRTNLCPTLQKINAGTVAVDQALAGTTIQAAIHYGTPPFAMTIDNTTGSPTGGFYYALQQEIARRGKFTFKYNNVPNCMVTLGTQKCLQYNLPHFDIYANNWYSDTSGRRYVGIGYTAELVDASVVFVSTDLNPRTTNSWTTSNYLWSILKPFSVQVSEWSGQASIAGLPFHVCNSSFFTVVRNASFIISTVLLRLSLSMERPTNHIIALIAFIFSVIIMAVLHLRTKRWLSPRHVTER